MKSPNGMESAIDSKTARFVGVLFLVAMVASLLGGGMVNAIISSANFLATSAENRVQLLIGVLLELTNALAVVGIAVVMFPILKRSDERMALGYLCLRVLEAVFCAATVITPLALLKLGQEHLKAAALGAQYLSASAALSIAVRAGIFNLLIPVLFCLGAGLFYSLLFRARLVPRFISVWGIIAVVLILAMNVVMLFQTTTLSTGVLMALALPIILNEIFLGIWLIVKGFNKQVIASARSSAGVMYPGAE